MGTLSGTAVDMTMTYLAQIEPEDLSPTELRVRELVLEFATSWKRTLGLAIELGDALRAHKGTLAHGEWLPWVDSRFELGRRMAQRFMDLAANASEMSHLPPGTPITAALEWLQQRNREPRPLPEPNSREIGGVPLLRFSQTDLPSATIVTLILRVAFPDAETALDVTYGSGQFWDGSAHVRVTAHDADPARAPDGVADFRNLSYGDDEFDVVLFDPPHIADAGDESIMGQRFGTYANADLNVAIREGAAEAWRVGRLGAVIKVTDHSHSELFQRETGWVIEAVGQEPYEIVHQVRGGALIDPKWQEQKSAYNNGSTYLIFRKGDQRHTLRTSVLQ